MKYTKPSIISLKKARYDDADILLRIKNDKDVRHFSIISHKKIRKEAHLRWLREKLYGGKTHLFIILKDGKVAGDVRFDCGKEIEVSIRLLPKFRSKGIGKTILAALPFKMTAKIVDENIHSLNLFTSCGFRFHEYKKGYYILRKT